MKARYESYSDAELTEFLTLRDTHAFEAIYNRYFALIYSFARKMLQDDNHAEDITQEVFTSLYEKMGRVHIESLRSYLYQSVRNMIIDFIRHKQVKTDYVTSFQSFYEQGEWATDNVVIENELRRQIENEIENLPPKMRAIFELSRKAHLSHKEIAAASGVTEGTVKKQLFYALKILRSRLSCVIWMQVMIVILWLNR
jgi:RNA polymerase sigma-70 factor (family 1)